MRQNMQNGREAYIAPSIEVIRIENEGVIAASGSTESYTPSTMSTTRSRSYNSASGSDLEDMINDILTVEN
ncbi:hypothetical protein [Bacteroides helcogenes]|uniref:Uncharacterized protein n=1 Tax=Bacteroides helcogenes (strain ATCC 35417 / DSM 20613 / JCM 6297 / CCUG 15421 / P 36-108) TaxID=693979 RepID=E6SSN9_BACT6|nr:hypothetical protein [Bacteroides helcogenes]ADV43152.1 hypothetical protein Bache_1142 [Bacteroides helcogenes P 36-108]MDY5239130.1 hypothetical protein [Bacteroides helcogenes]